MFFPRVCVFFMILEFAVFEAGFCQQECQAQVVVTTQAQLNKQIRREITRAFQSFTGVANVSATAPTANTPTGGLAEQVVALIDDIDDKLEAVITKLDSLDRRMNVLHELGLSSCHAASSCAEILESDAGSPSGYYWVQNTTGHPHSVYCDMTRTCGGVSGGWMRVAYLDMTNSSHQCPSGLRQRTDSGIRTCAAYSDSATCSSVLHRSHGMHYSRVCGKIEAYHYRSMDGFLTVTPARVYQIGSNYLDGVGLTHGRYHIWSFAASINCPCENVPSFVGSDYFCDGPLVRPLNSVIDLANPLWDGEDCGSNTCCHRNNPPWFHKQLLQPTTDDIQMRVCRDEDRSNEDIGVEVIEIYVQ